MLQSPLVSFIVLSYNNARFIRRTLDSIFSQTSENYEVVIVDDGSSDNSVDIINSYNDPRVRLFAHPNNLGLTPRYNEAIAHARGDFLVNLDTDDYIHPEKTAKQLACFDADASLGVVGSYIDLIDENDQPHDQAALMEGMLNRVYDFNDPAAWVVQNMLVRSSTMMRRQLHEQVGPNEIGMLRAPDYDLWTRGLQAGFRYHVIPERLTSYRLHSAGLTYGDPKATFLELSYALLRRLLPLLSAAGEAVLIAKALNWMLADPQFLALPAASAERLAGLFARGVDPGAYLDYLRFLEDGGADDDTGRTTGRRLIELQRGDAARWAQIEEALQWQTAQHANWEAEASAQKAQNDEVEAMLRDQRQSTEALEAAMAWHAQQAENWKTEAGAQKERGDKLEAALEAEHRSVVALQEVLAQQAESRGITAAPLKGTPD
ncbi:MAG: hypothetical protein C0481_02340 [Phenylobacterium sp.]|uniref:glycosyltransferase family 2 protein n=1 Tax=Phenylobacterium sp. TaxID=1871053 RepID=UPI0025D360FB|nr:glycosyltransferase [Phenylobacterium sp.]MBA4010683.1 hypothetical protein [Phenylobacterium sp.]